MNICRTVPRGTEGITEGNFRVTTSRDLPLIAEGNFRVTEDNYRVTVYRLEISGLLSPMGNARGTSGLQIVYRETDHDDRQKLR